MQRTQFTLWQLTAAALGLLPTALSCRDSPPRPSPSSEIANGVASLAEGSPPLHPVSATDALKQVEALPEMRSLMSRRGLKAKVIASPLDGATCSGDLPSDECAWHIAVADKASWDSAGQLEEEVSADFRLKVDAKSGTMFVQSSDEEQFRAYATWKIRYHQRQRAVAIILSIPEWQAESQLVKRPRPDRGRAELGLLLEGEPASHCEAGTAECRWRFMALSLCDGCAGHWLRFEVDPIRETLFVENVLEPEMSPYELWRNVYRIEHQGATALERELADVKQAFPQRDPSGEKLGYGKASVSDNDPLVRDPAMQLAIANGGHRLIRVERYGIRRFPVLVLETTASAVTAVQGLRFRKWCTTLLRANSGRAFELRLSSSPERYQVDSSILWPTGGGIYAFRDGNFHPWTLP